MAALDVARGTTPERPHLSRSFSRQLKLSALPQQIAVIHTGGTISCTKDADGAWVPERGVLAQCFEKYHQFRQFDGKVVIVELPTLLDSTNMRPEHWKQLAETVYELRHDYRGFVITHGTDTLAYTAAALSFLLPGLDRPVVLTGSQLPLVRGESDGLSNLLGALTVALAEDPIPVIPNVLVYFAQKLMRGTRVTKINSVSFEAFASPNCSLVGFHTCEGFLIDTALVESLSTQGHELWEKPPHRLASRPVQMLHVCPGLDFSTVEHLIYGAALRAQLDAVRAGKDAKAVDTAPLICRGLVLQTYGVGNAPDTLVELLESMVVSPVTCEPYTGLSMCQDVVLVKVTECTRGAAMAKAYGTTLDPGVCVNLIDMTPECAVAKLSVALGRVRGPTTNAEWKEHVSAIRTRMGTSWQGELTRNPVAVAGVVHLYS